MALVRKVDFTNVKDSSGINPVHMEPGDYLAKIVKVMDSPAKDDTPMWCFILQLNDRASATYPYYCKFQENQLWKLRNLLVAAGKKVPKAAVRVNSESIVGQMVGISLDDEEYDGKMKSVISAVFPASEMVEEDGSSPEDDSDEPEDDEELDLDDL